VSAQKGLTLAAAAQAFIEQLEAAEKSTVTVRAYRSDLGWPGGSSAGRLCGAV